MEELDAAKEDALSEDTVIEEAAEVEEDTSETIEEDVEEEVEEEEVEEEIQTPTDQKDRSQLGRKIAALFAKSDKTDEILLRQSEILERLLPQEYDEEEDLPVTRKELNQMMNQQKVESTQYEKDFKETFHQLCEVNNLTEEESEGVGAILLEKYNTRVAGDGKLDGAMNFEKARAEFFKPKKLPLKKRKAPGVITKQKSAVKQKKSNKLDAVSEKYLAMIERLDGAERAERLRKTL